MAHGFVSSTDARGDLNLGALIAGKVKNAIAMSAEERKTREAEIEALENKEELTAEETERLEFLKNQDTERKEGGVGKSFFAKAMMSEFGGDRLRKTKGIFSKNPEEYQDPSLTKEQRFSALLDRAAKPADAPVAPEDDIRPEEYGDAIYQAPTPQQGSLEKLLEIIKGQYATIAGKVSSLGSEEKKSVAVQESNTSNLARMTAVLESIKSYFNTDNKLKGEENKLEKDKIELQLDAEADAKASSESASMASGEDLSTFESLDTLEDQKARNEGDPKKGKGLLGSLMDGVGGLFKMFGKGGGKTPGVKPSTQYTNPIGPQPMNSSSPWAAKGVGERGGMFGGGGFTPRMESAPKLSEGGTVPVQKFSEGVVTNPTTMDLPPGSSVIPLNRNNALAKTFKAAGETGGESKMSQPMAEVMQLPSKVGGGLLLSLLNVAMDKMGGLAHFVKPVIKQIATPVAAMFGLPATVVSGLFAGPAAAATLDGAGGQGGSSDGMISKLTSMLGRSSGNGSPTTTPPGAGADLSGTSVVNEVTAQGLVAAAGTAGAHAEVGVTTRFGQSAYHGRHHNGVDIGTSKQKGYKVAFGRGGTVTHSGPASTYGNLVIIKDSTGTEYYFAHLANINPELTVGAQYTGQTIGEIGATGGGLTNGEHLHFEKRPPGSSGVDPMPDIGLLSIGKQTTGGSNNPLTAPVITANKNRPTPKQVAASTQLKAGQSGPVIPMPTKTPPPAAKTPPPPQGLSKIFQVQDPSGAGDAYLSWM